MMATRSASVNASSPRAPSGRFDWSRKLVLLSLLILAAALGLTILFRRNTNAPLFLFNAFADAALGVVAGFGSRLVFRRRHWTLYSLHATRSGASARITFAPRLPLLRVAIGC